MPGGDRTIRRLIDVNKYVATCDMVSGGMLMELVVLATSYAPEHATAVFKAPVQESAPVKQKNSQKPAGKFSFRRLFGSLTRYFGVLYLLGDENLLIQACKYVLCLAVHFEIILLKPLQILLLRKRATNEVAQAN